MAHFSILEAVSDPATRNVLWELSKNSLNGARKIKKGARGAKPLTIL